MKVFTAAELKPWLRNPRVQMSYLVEFKFSLMNIGFDDLCFTTNTHTLFWSGREWLGAGGMLEVTLPQEDSTLEVHACEISLDGLDPAVISLALNVAIENTPVEIWILLHEPDTNQPVQSYRYLRGTISEVKIVPPSVSTLL